MAEASRLRIVHAVRSDSFAGVERSILLSARALAMRGHDVSVIGGSPPIMRQELRDCGVSWRPAASTLDVVRQLWQSGSADVVHAHMTAAESAAVLTRRRTGGALVVTRHFAQRRGRTVPGRLAAAVIDRVPHRELAISWYVAGSVGEGSEVVHHGIDDRRPAPLEAHRVVVIQRLEPEKNTAAALDIWGRSRLRAEGWELVIAGDGSERPMLERMAHDLGLSPSVRFVGRVDDVDGLRRGASMQLATALGEHFGLSLLEAMSVGLPVVAPDSGAHRELLGDDNGELLYPTTRPAAAAERLGLLAADSAVRQRIGASLRRRQQEEFSLAAHGEALEAAYRRAMGAA
jgi:glycosyltransferase involved in cell wall biosynthesis